MSAPQKTTYSHRLVYLGLATTVLFTSGLWFSPLFNTLLKSFNTPVATAQIAPERSLKTLTVSGQGRENIATSLSQVTLGVDAQGKTAQEVQQEVARRSAAVVALLRSRNVEKLETTGVNLNPNYTVVNNRQQLTGYTGSNTVSFRIATEKMGGLLDDAVRAGASNINSLSFIATDEAIAAARQRALRSATLDAQEQAKAVLAALNLQPSEIIGITINNASAPGPQPLNASLAGGDLRQAKLEVIGGEQQVNATVTLQIRY
jgi:uncharacterized protein YggE